MKAGLPWLAAAILAAGCSAPGDADYAGPQFVIDPERISVSGISAGAYMAGQMHVAMSSAIEGAGLIAGGPYGCAQNSLQTALENCTREGSVDLDALRVTLEGAASEGSIDDIVNLDGSPVWLFRSPDDPLVGQALLDATAEQYRTLGAAVTIVDDVAAAHGVPTLQTGAVCDSFESPYLNACDYDAAGEILSKIHGPLEPRTEATGELMAISVPGAESVSLLPDAFLYVPAACAAGETCGLHVFFHGCSQSSELVGDAVARGAGFNAWAESNRMLVLYPQVKSSKIAPVNPLGCFDWWGYTGDRYATREGAQVRVIAALMAAIGGSWR
jgi:hypothetical protein